jgi:hypothetical protein
VESNKPAAGREVAPDRPIESSESENDSGERVSDGSTIIEPGTDGVRNGMGKMRLPQTGGCQCGRCRYEISKAPAAVYTCHCKACQQVTGSAFSMALLVDDAFFTILSGALRSIERTADSGRTVVRLVCEECGSWVCNAPRPDGRRVRAGTLDDVTWLRPTLHFWVRSKQPWVVLPATDRVFQTESDW